MKNVFKVKLKGLNKFGVDEIIKYYQPNIEIYGERAILENVKVGLNPLKVKTKTMKNQPTNETNVGVYDCFLYVPNLIGYGPKLSLQLKHFNYEVEIFTLNPINN
jgi:hypothetical protein